MKKAILVAAFSVLAGTAHAQQTYTVALNDQQITGIIDAGSACLEKVPLACARLVIYINDLLTEARKKQPKKPE